MGAVAWIMPNNHRYSSARLIQQFCRRPRSHWVIHSRGISLLAAATLSRRNSTHVALLCIYCRLQHAVQQIRNIFIGVSKCCTASCSSRLVVEQVHTQQVHIKCKTSHIYTVWTILTFVINYSQFKCVCLLENMFAIFFGTSMFLHTQLIQLLWQNYNLFTQNRTCLGLQAT